MAGNFQVNVTAAHQALAAEIRTIPNFCATWPTVKQVLQAISGATTNPFVKLAITVIISAGDAICGNK